MDNSYIFKILDDINVQRTMIFTSLSSKDKGVALRLVKRIESMGFNHWCMYDENGKERNISELLGGTYQGTVATFTIEMQKGETKLFRLD